MNKKIAIAGFAGLVGVFFVTGSASAQEGFFYREANLIAGYSGRDKWVDRSDDQVSSVGFEDFRKFSGDYGDFLTTDLQVRLAYDSRESSDDAWGLQVHNAWMLFKLGGTKLRLGHFDPAFGLEPQVDTHGTLLQTLSMKDIGFNRDWGLGLEGAVSRFDYKTALQLGSGMSVYRRDRSFLWTGRVGTPSRENLQYGLSLMVGRVLRTMGMTTFPRAELMSDEAVLKKRVGLDGQSLFGPFLFKAEASYGTNDNDEVLGYLVEADYTLPRHQNVELELQFQTWMNDPGERSQDDATLTLGASYKIDQKRTLRAAYSHDFNMTEHEEEDRILFQFYFYGV